ncbi:MAG: bifunctional DNA primase/polymerase [Thermoproteota archaeon]|nr:bifunctional DNA primase/polymerase [Thermoproteota archaeon]
MEDSIIDVLGTDILWTDGKPHSEIKILGNGHYIVAAPSRHPNGKLYEWNEKTPDLITKDELQEFIRLVANDSMTKKIPIMMGEHNDKDNNSEGQITTTLTTVTAAASSKEILQELFEVVKPLYVDGSRDELIFCLSGFMRKEGSFSLEDCKEFFTMLCTWAKQYKYSDEDIHKSLRVVEDTYKNQ